jgi:hypothetical protein
MTEEPPPTDNPSTVDAAGVDLTLIAWFQTLTPTERLKTLQNYLESIEKLRRANEDSSPPDDE